MNLFWPAQILSFSIHMVVFTNWSIPTWMLCTMYSSSTKISFFMPPSSFLMDSLSKTKEKRSLFGIPWQQIIAICSSFKMYS
jgi:hypothetical protein